MPRILTSYILREVAVPFSLGVVVLTITALLGKIVKLLELFFSGYADITHLLLFIAAVMPTFLIYVIPAGFLAATLIAVTRMSSDSEMTALKAGGISLYPVMKPVLIFMPAPKHRFELPRVIFGIERRNKKGSLLYEAASK